MQMYGKFQQGLPAKKNLPKLNEWKIKIMGFKDRFISQCYEWCPFSGRSMLNSDNRVLCILSELRLHRGVVRFVLLL